MFISHIDVAVFEKNGNGFIFRFRTKKVDDVTRDGTAPFSVCVWVSSSSEKESDGECATIMVIRARECISKGIMAASN